MKNTGTTKQLRARQEKNLIKIKLMTKNLDLL